MRDVAEPPKRNVERVRESLEPMLDDLARGLGYDRALVLEHHADSGTLRGIFGLNLRDDQVRALSVSLSRSDDPFVVALRAGAPQLVDDVSADARLDIAERQALLAMNVTRFVATALPGAGNERQSTVVVLARDREIREVDLDRLMPFAQQAGAALTREYDVELLRRASESHAVEKEWLWWMLNAVDDPVLVADAQNEILHFNRRAEFLFRASDEESAGKRRAVWMNNFLFTASLSTWSLDRSSRGPNREVTLVDPIEGNELIFEVITMTALNHRTGERGTVSVLKDVTDIRHMTQELTRNALRIQTADEEIRAERDRLDLVLTSVPNPIIVVDNDNQIISLNAAAQLLFTTPDGRGAQHALANDAKFTSFLSGFRLDPATTTRAEITLVDPQSTERLEMEITATEVSDQHGAVVAIVSAMQEVGRLRELERRRLQQVLFETEKLAATGRLAASIAHEINNPLEAVQNAIYLLSSVVKKDVAEYKYLEIARRETQRMSRILRQMLGFYKPGMDLAAIDVNTIIEDAEGLVAKRLRQAKITLVRDLDPTLPRIRASADQMKQVLLNLLLNAVEAMPDGGTLTVTTRYARPTERDMPFDSVRIEVKDTGVGMDEETQARIFEAFFSTKTQKGTGLGLWVSHGIVQGHGGAMKVRSRVGEGTTFIIALPVAGPPEETDG
jgi:signal transduction histidine kinase